MAERPYEMRYTNYTTESRTYSDMDSWQSRRVGSRAEALQQILDVVSNDRVPFGTYSVSGPDGGVTFTVGPGYSIKEGSKTIFPGYRVDERRSEEMAWDDASGGWMVDLVGSNRSVISSVMASTREDALDWAVDQARLYPAARANVAQVVDGSSGRGFRATDEVRCEGTGVRHRDLLVSKSTHIPHTRGVRALSERIAELSPQVRGRGGPSAPL